MVRVLGWVFGLALALVGAAGAFAGIFVVIAVPDEVEKLIGGAVATVGASIAGATVAVQRSLVRR